MLVVLGAVHADGPARGDAVRAPAGHAAAAVRALDFWHGPQGGRVGLRWRDCAVLGLNILDPDWLRALHRLLLLPALLLPGLQILLLPLLLLSQRVLLLEPSSPPQEAPIFEHIVRVRVQGPVAAFTRLFVITGHFDKTLIQRQIVPDAVLPALFVISVKRKSLHNKLIYPV